MMLKCLWELFTGEEDADDVDEEGGADDKEGDDKDGKVRVNTNHAPTHDQVLLNCV